MAFMDMVRQKQIEIGSDCLMPPMTDPEVRVTAMRTQVGSLSNRGGQLISILLTDERWESDRDVDRSDRTAVYDGVIECSPDFVLIIENKPRHRDVWSGQLDPGIDVDPDTKIDRKQVVLIWRDIISCLTGLIPSGGVEQSGIAALGGTQAAIIDDFLSFVWANFSFLNPYDRFGLCRNDEYLLKSRCRQILDSLTEATASHHRGWEDIIRLSDGPAAMVTLHPVWPESDGSAGNGWDLELALYPGDTMNQARSLYARLDEKALLQLVDDGDCRCAVRGNLHFSYIGTNLVWASRDAELVDIGTYVQYWKENTSGIRQVTGEPTDFEDLFSGLEEAGLITGEDRRRLRKEFSETNRSHVRICPGIAVEFRWSARVACDNDNASGQLEREIAKRIRQALSTWGQEMIPSE